MFLPDLDDALEHRVKRERQLLDGQDNCDHSDGPPLMIAGLIGFTVFRIWEIVDAFGGDPVA